MEVRPSSLSLHKCVCVSLTTPACHCVSVCRLHAEGLKATLEIQQTHWQQCHRIPPSNLSTQPKHFLHVFQQTSYFWHFLCDRHLPCDSLFYLQHWARSCFSRCSVVAQKSGHKCYREANLCHNPRLRLSQKGQLKVDGSICGHSGLQVPLGKSWAVSEDVASVCERMWKKHSTKVSPFIRAMRKTE